ncbi:MAG: hypothetical protein GY702_26640 [Desulfobulbaceae bacterium]|nr:hypothetical protein [Desulfobulbaceae bacterium]
MSDNTELQRLEKFVEKLLAKFAELKDEKNKLVQVLSERDALIHELQGDISTKNSERTEISERVNNMVDQIELWEMSLEEDEAEVAPDEQNSEGDYSAEDGAGESEDEGRVQHNLFS